MTIRKIIHVDMDAFYASVEQRDNPELKGRSVVVGGQPESRGVVAACSYEARKFGIHSAMPCSKAYRLCPQTVFLSPRFKVYKEVSRQIHLVFAKFTSLIEPLSLDEAYLDVTHSECHQGSAILMAREIKYLIKDDTGLTASAGVASNKFLAKVASDMDKPDGLYVILPEEGETFISTLPIGKFFGVGPVTEKKMHALGIETGEDLKELTLLELESVFGKSAQYYFNIARGIDNRQVQNSRERKSIGAETTFEKDKVDVHIMLEVLESLAQRVGIMLQSQSLRASTITVKVKYADFKQVTRSHSNADGFETAEEITACFPWLLARTQVANRAVRLLGVSVSGLVADNEFRQLSFDL